MKKNIPLLILYLALIVYLVINTGIVSDDFAAMSRVKGKQILDIIIPSSDFGFIATPVSFLSHNVWYLFFNLENTLIPDVLKIIYIFLAFYLISRFFSIFVDDKSAFMISLLFIYFPSHDSTVYWFMLHYLTLSFAFYLFAYYMAYRDKIWWAFFFAGIASFASYGSSPIAISLFCLCLFRREIKKGFILLIPNIIYIFYYFFVSKIAETGVDKFSKSLGVTAFLKQFALQIVTFCDAVCGPSMWLKVYYSFGQLSFPSIIIGILLTVLFYRKGRQACVSYRKEVVFSFALLAVLSFGLFAMTGRYPQIAFNLGNRVTIFGSLLCAYLIVSIPVSHKIRTVIFGVIILCVLGISDHWKNWNVHQQMIISNMTHNRELDNYHDGDTIFISGNQYSNFGPISHIEFLSESWVTKPLVKLISGREIDVLPLNKRMVYEKGYLIDTKYNTKIPVDGPINVYDSERNMFLMLLPEEINGYINSLQPDLRHWVQMINNRFMKKILLKLMPRLEYAF